MPDRKFTSGFDNYCRSTEILRFKTLTPYFHLPFMRGNMFKNWTVIKWVNIKNLLCIRVLSLKVMDFYTVEVNKSTHSKIFGGPLRNVVSGSLFNSYVG